MSHMAIEDRFSKTMVVGGFSSGSMKSDVIAWLEDKLTQICKFGPTNIYAKGEFKNMLWVKFDSRTLRDSAVVKLSKADLKHVDHKIWISEDKPLDIRAKNSILFGIRKLLMTWGFHKNALWIDEVAGTIHFNVDLICTAQIVNGKLNISYGPEWEHFLKQGNLETIVQKGAAMVQKIVEVTGKGKGKNKEKILA